MLKFKTLTGSTKTLRYSKKYLVDWQKESLSFFQTDVKVFLCPFWKNDTVYEEMPIVGTRLSLDLYNATKKIAIEVQGQQHTKYVKFFHKSRIKFLEQLKRDGMKEEFAELNGINLIRVYHDDEITKDLFLEQGVTL